MTVVCIYWLIVKKPQIEQLGLLLYHCRMSQKPERLMMMTVILMVMVMKMIMMILKVQMNPAVQFVAIVTYSGGSGSNFLPGDCLSWLIFVALLSLSRQISG